MERFLSAGELARLGAALAEAERRGVEMRVAVAAVRLLAFTGAQEGATSARRRGLSLAPQLRLPERLA